MKKQGKKKSGSSGGKRSQSQLLKVVYISSPMKVQASASEFRSVVQELTGRDSDVARFMDEHQSDHDNDESDNSSAPTVSKILNDERPAINNVDSGSYYSSLQNQNDRLLFSDDDHKGNFLFDVDSMLSGERSFQEGFPFGFHQSSFLDVFN